MKQNPNKKKQIEKDSWLDMEECMEINIMLKGPLINILSKFLEKNLML